MDICISEQFTFDTKIYENYLKLYRWPNDIGYSSRSSIANIKKNEVMFLTKLENEKSMFLIQIQDVAIKVELLKEFDDFTKFEEYLPQIHFLYEQFVSILNQVKSFNEREALFKLRHSNFEEVEELYHEFMPYFKLWDLAEEFENEKRDWLTTPIIKLNYTQIQQHIVKLIQETLKLSSLFQDN